MQMRYHPFSVFWHWLMALVIVLMLASGWAMTSDFLAKPLRFSLYQWHKTFGVLLLFLWACRIFTRIMYPPPPMPLSFRLWEKRLAQTGTIAFYLLMLIVPLSGWLMVSLSPLGYPTLLFGIWEWPMVPGILPDAQIHGTVEEGHALVAYSLLAVMLLHLGAVAKHHLIDKMPLLPRMMVPFTNKS
jgi:cytochrome b561